MSTRTRSDRRGWCFALWIATASVATPALAEEPAPNGALASLRERFQQGMEKFQSGHFAEAIVVWEAIYRELGAEKGYRLAFNLGLAYDSFGDATRAAEYYETFVAAATAQTNTTVDFVVAKQVAETKERLLALASTMGRLAIATRGARAVKIDGGAERLANRGLVTYVAPGRHVVTFEPGTPDEQTVDVVAVAGKVLELAAPERPLPRPAPEAAPAPVRFEARVEHPFPKPVLYVAGAVTLASVLVPIGYWAHASSVADDYAAATSREDALRLRADYNDSARPTYNATLAIPIVLGAVTTGLVAYWLWGGRTVRVPLREASVRF